MPPTHHAPTPTAPGTGTSPRGTSETRPPAPRTPTHHPGPGPAPETAPVLGRIPVLDVRPLVLQGRRPAKAVVDEEFEISATVFREGHDAVAAHVVLTDPEGRPGPPVPMRELAPGTDRWGATVSVPREGNWTYAVEGWSDPLATWRHHATVKIPAGIDTDLVLEEGALLHERAAAGLPEGEDARAVLLAAADALRDTGRPASARLAGALAPGVVGVLGRFPLRELVSSSGGLG
ncbi:maltotransferase domain-containing protein, partial [Streptomyces sp. NPDC052040]|uniref:maltotransferase domain-containing protein n=1 Tax=Streptomyces sp. NPDC052040 TaxID=3365682 RepID=UPI0037CE80C3